MVLAPGLPSTDRPIDAARLLEPPRTGRLKIDRLAIVLYAQRAPSICRDQHVGTAFSQHGIGHGGK